MCSPPPPSRRRSTATPLPGRGGAACTRIAAAGDALARARAFGRARELVCCQGASRALHALQQADFSARAEAGGRGRRHCTAEGDSVAVMRITAPIMRITVPWMTVREHRYRSILWLNNSTHWRRSCAKRVSCTFIRSHACAMSGTSCASSAAAGFARRPCGASHRNSGTRTARNVWHRPDRGGTGPERERRWPGKQATCTTDAVNRWAHWAPRIGSGRAQRQRYATDATQSIRGEGKARRPSALADGWRCLSVGGRVRSVRSRRHGAGTDECGLVYE